MAVTAAMVIARRDDKGISMQQAKRELYKESLLRELDAANSLAEVKEIVYKIIKATM